MQQPLLKIDPVDHRLVTAGRRSSVGLTQEETFPGWGEVQVCGELDASAPDASKPHRLGELAATAICGNDITGSCFYVTGSLAAAAGVWAPFGAIIATATLWLFRWVYTEAVTALPFNGGIYNILLNVIHSKKIAGSVATLTILSYIATCVVSALSAGSYLQAVLDNTKKDPLEPGCHILPVSISLIVFFAILKIIGISESAKVAAFMFVFHLFTMAVLIVVTFVSIIRPTGILPMELVMRNLDTNFHYTGGTQHISHKIVLGFSSAMLGVSGFESSANFVEEQADGVFPKTLRNMWYAVSILNITFICECVFATQLEELVAHDKNNALAYLARKSAGRWLEVWVSLDAFMVLAAAVLTAYVGVGGLASRMGGDRCLPQIFQKDDRITTVLFMIVCISMVLVLEGDSTKLGACYSFAFLTVMLLFAVSLVALQTQRPKLPRDMKNNLIIPALAAILVSIALGGSIVSSADVIPVFFAYWSVLVSLVVAFMWRLRVLKVASKVVKLLKCCPPRFVASVSKLTQKIQKDSSVVYFSKTSNICRLNKAVQYIIQNEDTNYCRIVHVYDDEVNIPELLIPFCQILDTIYPSVKIDVVFVNGQFGASLIMQLSNTWGIAPNLMFITCPTSDEAGKRLQDLRGVRVIMGHEEEILSRDHVSTLGSSIPTPTSAIYMDETPEGSIKGTILQPKAGRSTTMDMGTLVKTLEGRANISKLLSAASSRSFSNLGTPSAVDELSPMMSPILERSNSSPERVKRKMSGSV